MQWLSLVQFIKFGRVDLVLALLPPATSIEASVSAWRRSLFAVQSAQQIS